MQRHTTYSQIARFLAVMGALAGFATIHNATAQSSDALLDKLVQKGVLTQDEATELKDEADKDFTKAHSVKTGLPEWVHSMKFNGDFRGRYEGFFAENPNFIDRNRFRYRVRFGFTAVMLDDLEVGFRLASGDDSGNAADPISTNTTLQNNGSKKAVGIDLAYAKWSPIHNKTYSAAFVGGKMENPFVVSDMVFDNDYTPEGLAQQFGYNLYASGETTHDLKLNFGEFILDELSASAKDPYLLGAQLRLESKWTPKISTSTGVGFLTLLGDDSLTSSAVPDINRGNSRNVTFSKPDASGNVTPTVGAPAQGYDTMVADASVTYTFETAPLYTGAFPIKAFGEFLHNGAAEERNNGWQVGMTFGKAGKKGTWELTYRYKWLEGDAWWEELTDSDFGAYYSDNLPSKAPGTGDPSLPTTVRTSGRGYGSGTNVKGHVVKAGYSPYDSLTLNITWFNTDLIDAYGPGSDSNMNRLQVDAVWKF